MHTLQQIEEEAGVEPLVAMFTEDAELSNLAMTEPLRARWHTSAGKVYQYLSASVHQCS